MHDLNRPSCRRRTMRFGLLALALLAAFGAAPTIADEDCARLPDGMLLPVGEELRLGDRAFEVDVERLQLPDGDATRTALDIALFARQIDPRTERSQPGSWEPGLEARFRLEGPDGVIGRGELSFALLTEGSAWVARVDLPEGVLASELSLMLDLEVPDEAVTLLERAGEPGTAGARTRGCYPLSLPLRFEAAALPAVEIDAPATARSVRSNQRAVLLGQLDARPADDSSDIWGWDNGETYIAIYGSFNGTVFVDVTDPTQPTEVAYIPGPGSSWRDIKTYQDYAYIVTEGAGAGEGMQIVDMSNPLAPALVNTYAVNFTTTHNIWIDEERAIAWLVGTDNGVRIVSIVDPVNPVEIGSWTVRYVHDAFVDGEFAYFSEVFSGFHEIFDATDPTNLVFQSRFFTPDNFTHNSYPNADRTLLGTTDERTAGHLTVYDITDKAAPSPALSTYEPNSASIVHNVFFDDTPRDRIAISHYGLGLKYVDVTRPSQPVELLSFDTIDGTSGFIGAWGTYPFDPRGYFYVSDIQTGLYVIDYVPDGGVLTGKLIDASNGQPVAGASVVDLTSGIELTTELDGEFGAVVPVGAKALRISAPGFQTRLVNAGEMILDDGLDLEIEMVPLPTTTLSGVVFDTSTAQPFVGATIEALGTGRTTTSGPGGTWQLDGVPLGQRTIAVEAFGYSGSDARVLVGFTPSGAIPLEVTPAVFLDTAETDAGWTTDPGTATQGFWVRADPVGTGNGSIQPEDDHTPSGRVAWITGQSLLGGSNPEFGDVDGGTVTLTSPTFDLSGTQNPAFSYHRWFSTSSGDLDGGFMRVEISGDGGNTWQTVELLGEDANEWNRVDVEVASRLPLTSDFRARFSCEAIVGFNNDRVLECAVDDLAIVEECRTRLVNGGADGDADGVLDACDSCPNDAANDLDQDGICGDVDNAPFIANADQTDSDGDGVGDVSDNCPADANPVQLDLDRDGLGNACDDDDDGDGVLDVADTDSDGDGVEDVSDICASVPDAAQFDIDANGTGDACDDADGVVHGLRVDREQLSWVAEQGATGYNLYRGDLGSPVLLPLAECRASNLASPLFFDTDLPEPGNGFFYLAAEVIGSVEGSLGQLSDGTPRAVVQSCD